MPNSRSLAVVTGATAGIGHVFAQRLAAAGHDLLLVARDAERLRDVCQALQAEWSVQAEAFVADLSTDEDIARLAERLRVESNGTTGRQMVLVSNAGFGTRGTIITADPDKQRRMLRLHVQATHELVSAVVPGMVARGAGTIIVVASVASWSPTAGNVNYNATKAYQRVYCEALATELVDSGVSVQALCPGFTYTEFHDRLGSGRKGIPSWAWLSADRVVDESLAQVARKGAVVCVPGKRFKLIVFLLKHAMWMLGSLRQRYRRDRLKV
ncbi:SDR family NAD(P)-dependent oxidoreductase [Gemmatimonas sp. UBA7669]|uniref:SDR family NAD(P)-dependent oxidoreductase n=1 Tax=Gemmatimonas sp. UBA7669 TaxID=1946568 RepID=UPI0025C450B0|nr:SDR family NAD(P)-dependent oxidoreductase [Gemmatimonas sp. UBA7669]